MAIRDRLRLLEAELGPTLCEERHCLRRTTMEVIRYPDGTEDRLGKEPPRCVSSASTARVAAPYATSRSSSVTRPPSRRAAACASHPGAAYYVWGLLAF
jgi:hypothetical protein